MSRLGKGRRLPLVLGFVLLTGCGASDQATSHDEPAVIEHFGEEARITLTQSALDRLGLETAPAVGEESLIVVPGGALLVDPAGRFWVYELVGPSTFARRPIALEREAGGFAYLSQGPEPGSEVVIVGAAELYGVEEGIGH